MARIDFKLLRLVSLELERAILDAEQKISEHEDPSEISEIVVDLSAIAWVDIGATAQLVIQVDGWARSYPAVVVHLPGAAQLATDSSEHDRQLRLAASRFLSYVRFREAMESLASRRDFKLTFYVDGRISSTVLPNTQDFPLTYRRVLPLHWVSLTDSGLRHRLAQHLTDALQDSGHGIDTPDAKALSNVILFELIQNVSQHAWTEDVALVCGFAHSEPTVGRHVDFLEFEQAYVKSAEESQQPILEVIVCDGGRGLAASLESSYVRGPGRLPGNLTKNGKALPHNVVRWAFDRWSTEKDASAADRGVRGLFRVDRLIAKYFGQVAVRTGKTLFVREHIVNSGLAERYNKAPKRFGYQFGTLIRVRMTATTVPSVAELASRYRLSASIPQAPLIGIESPEVLVAPALVVDGFSTAFQTKVLELVAGVPRRPASLQIIFSGQAPAARSIESALRFLSSNSRPIPIYALNLPCSVDELDSIAISLNAECEDTDHSSDGSASWAERLDPILAMNESGATRWVGLPLALASALGTVGPGEQKKIPSEMRTLVLRWEARLKPFFAVEGDRAEPIRGIRCVGDTSPASRSIVDRFKSAMTADDIHTQKNHWQEGPYLTPTLSFASRWMRIEKLVVGLPSSIFSELVFELSVVLRRSFGDDSESGKSELRNLLLAVEERSSRLIANDLARRFQLGKLKILSSSSGADASLEAPHTVPVIVYGDIVGTGESLRRAVQSVLRQGYPVVAVVALVDMRKDVIPHIEAFGQKIPLITLIHDPNEESEPAKFSVISPSLLHIEARRTSTAEVIKAHQLNRGVEPYIWKALEFGHKERPNGRHLTLTLKPQVLVESELFVGKLEAVLRENELVRSALISIGGLLVLCPADEFDDDWRNSVQQLFSRLGLGITPRLEFVERVTVGRVSALDRVSPLSARIRAAGVVLIFDWGVISGTTIDSLTNDVLEAGARRILVVVGNSQLSRSEHAYRTSVRGLSRVKQIETRVDLLSPGTVTLTEDPVEYRFISLSQLPLGHYLQNDCPVCTQELELFSFSCPDHFIATYRDSALSRMREPEAVPSPKRASRVDWQKEKEQIAAMRALLVASNLSTTARFTFAQFIRQESRNCARLKSLSPLHLAVVELLYVEGQWIQVPPMRYRSCRESVKTIVFHVIRFGDEDSQAKAISVLRRLSKTEFMRRAPDIFSRLPNKPRAQGALLFGIHTYLARRYHETLGMLEPAISTLHELQVKATDDGNTLTPGFAQSYASLRYLEFQAAFLRSRAQSRDMGLVDALRQLRELFSEPNYFAHGVQNQAIELLLGQQFLNVIQEALEAEAEKGVGALSAHPSTWRRLLDMRIDAWRDLHRFLAIKVIPLASAARVVFESRHFAESVGPGQVQWFLNLLDIHRNGLAPELIPSHFLDQLQKAMDDDENRMPPRELLELMKKLRADLENYFSMLLRARRFPQAGRPTDEASLPSLVKQFLDELSTNAAEIILRVTEEFRIKYGLEAVIEYSLQTQPADYLICFPAGVLRYAIGELLDNSAKHGSTNGSGAAHVGIKFELDSDSVSISITNAHGVGSAQVSDPQRHGLELIKKDLASYKGLVSLIEGNSHFTVQLVFRRWI